MFKHCKSQTIHEDTVLQHRAQSKIQCSRFLFSMLPCVSEGTGGERPHPLSHVRQRIEGIFTYPRLLVSGVEIGDGTRSTGFVADGTPRSMPARARCSRRDSSLSLISFHQSISRSPDSGTILLLDPRSFSCTIECLQ